MIGKWGFWIALSGVIVAAMMFAPVANAAGLPTNTPTYGVSFTESGLPSGTSWTVTFNSVAHSGTGSTITVTGVSAGSSYYYTVSNSIGGKPNTQYFTATDYGYLNVPYEDKVAVVYTTQYYVTFGVTPTSSGSTNPTSNWFNAYTNLSIAASTAVGYSWSTWSVSNTSLLVLGKPTLESTNLQINHPGSVVAHFIQSKYTASFTESGLPAGTHWSVLLNGISSSGTTATLTSTGNAAGNDQWIVAPVPDGSTAQYAPAPSTAYMNIPYQLSQEIVFVKQYQITFGVSPGGSGSTTPTGTAYYTSGSSFPIFASASTSWVFSHWGVNQSRIGLGSTTLAGTNATIKDSGTVTGVFVAGTHCTTCTLTFHEVGLPAKTAWGVDFNGYYYPTGSTSLVFTGLTAEASWSAFSPVGVGQSGVAYYPTGTSSSEWYVGSTNSIQVVYQQYDYVTFQTNPYNSGGSSTISSGWYPYGSVNALSAIGSATYKFSSWSSSSSNVTLGSTSGASTTMKVTGPGVVTENFVSPTVTLHFIEYGLPSGSAWGINVNSVPYFSPTQWLNISGAGYGGYSISPYTNWYGVAGTQWAPTTTSFDFTAPYQTYQAVHFAKEVYVTFTTSGSGYVSPGSNWYWVGSELPILAENVSGSTFHDWTQTAGTATLGSTTSSGTTAIIKAPGTITANFT
ncbi:MAG: hypothetical protein ABSA63_06640 [Thermoplasmata archaeon]|jgi:List-Bact-rpt repeat protein